MNDEELLGIKTKKISLDKVKAYKAIKELQALAETMMKKTPHTKTAEKEKEATITRSGGGRGMANPFENMYIDDAADAYAAAAPRPPEYITLDGYGAVLFSPEKIRYILANERAMHSVTNSHLNTQIGQVKKLSEELRDKKEELRKAKVENDSLKKQVDAIIEGLAQMNTPNN